MELFNENRKCKRMWREVSEVFVPSLPPPPPGLLGYIRVLQLTSHVCQANDSAYLTPGKIRESGGNWFFWWISNNFNPDSKLTPKDLVWKNYNCEQAQSIKSLQLFLCSLDTRQNCPVDIWHRKLWGEKIYFSSRYDHTQTANKT